MIPQISICIPTYNRSSYLKDTIQSIVTQERFAECEIVISDNNSTDNTKIMVGEFQKKYPNILLSINSSNLGPDANYMLSTMNASGKFIWFLGSDDQLEHNSLIKVLNMVKMIDSTIFLIGRNNYDKNLINVISSQSFSKKIEPVKYKLSDDFEFQNYINQSNDLAAIFSYLSSIVINRESWNLIPNVSQYYGSAYSHVAKIFKIINETDATIYVTQQYLIKNRTGNDFFTGDGFAKRRIIDLNYLHISESIFGKFSMKNKCIKKFILKEFFSIRKIISFKYWVYKYEGKNGFVKLYEGYERAIKGHKFKFLFWKHLPISVVNTFYSFFKR